MDHKYASVRSPAHITCSFDVSILGLVFKKVRIPDTHSITFKMIITFPTFFMRIIIRPVFLNLFWLWFGFGNTYFDNKKFATLLVYQNHRKVKNKHFYENYNEQKFES